MPRRILAEKEPPRTEVNKPSVLSCLPFKCLPIGIPLPTASPKTSATIQRNDDHHEVATAVADQEPQSANYRDKAATRKLIQQGSLDPDLLLPEYQGVSTLPSRSDIPVDSTSLTNKIAERHRGELGSIRIIHDVEITEKYEFRDAVLGTGISGEVRVGKNKSTGIPVAIKTLPTRNLSANRFSMLCNEVEIYLGLDHPNICKLIEVFEDDQNIYLVMELCTGKELYERLANQRRFSEVDAAFICYQMLEAINYCHLASICHRDLKLENWVYSSLEDDARLKLIDFGFSRVYDPGTPMTAVHGTVYYVAPEVLKGSYSIKCDIWSIGVIAYMILSGAPPFNGSCDADIIASVQVGHYSFDGPRWSSITPEGKRFIRYLLVADPNIRPTAREALNHPWIVSNMEIYRKRCSRKSSTASVISRKISNMLISPISKGRKNSKESNKSGESSHRRLSTLSTVKSRRSGHKKTVSVDSRFINPDVALRMKQFAKQNVLRRATMGVIAYSLSNGQVDDLLEEFLKLDVDHTGTVKWSDLRQALLAVTVTDKVCDEVMTPVEEFTPVLTDICDSETSMDVAEKNRMDLTLLKKDLRDKRVGKIETVKHSTFKRTRALLSEKEVVDIFEKMDLSGDQKIHYCEFLASCFQARIQLEEPLLREAFEKFDNRHTGCISVEDVRRVLGTGADDKLEEVFAMFDHDNDGYINYEEFLSAVKQPDGFTSTGHQTSSQNIVQDDSGQMPALSETSSSSQHSYIFTPESEVGATVSQSSFTVTDPYTPIKPNSSSQYISTSSDSDSLSMSDLPSEYVIGAESPAPTGQLNPISSEQRLRVLRDISHKICHEPSTKKIGFDQLIDSPSTDEYEKEVLKFRYLREGRNVKYARSRSYD